MPSRSSSGSGTAAGDGSAAGNRGVSATSPATAATAAAAAKPAAASIGGKHRKDHLNEQLSRYRRSRRGSDAPVATAASGNPGSDGSHALGSSPTPGCPRTIVDVTRQERHSACQDAPEEGQRIFSAFADELRRPGGCRCLREPRVRPFSRPRQLPHPRRSTHHCRRKTIGKA